MKIPTTPNKSTEVIKEFGEALDRETGSRERPLDIIQHLAALLAGIVNAMSPVNQLAFIEAFNKEPNQHGMVLACKKPN